MKPFEFCASWMYNILQRRHSSFDVKELKTRNISFTTPGSQSKLFDQCHRLFLSFSRSLYSTRVLATMDRSTSMVPTSNFKSSYSRMSRVTSYRSCHISELGIATVAVAPLGHCLASSRKELLISAVLLPQIEKPQQLSIWGKNTRPGSIDERV